MNGDGALYNAVVGIVERVKQVTDGNNFAKRSAEIQKAILTIDLLILLGTCFVLNIITYIHRTAYYCANVNQFLFGKNNRM